MSEETTTEETTATETDSGETDFNPITSRADLNKVLAAERRKDRALIADLKSKAEKWEESERSKLTLAEQHEATIKQLKSELDAERTARTREGLLRTILRDKGLSDDAAEFIHGSDRDELEASAERFLQVHGTAAKPKPDPKKLKSSFGAESRMDPMEKAAAMMRAFRGQT